SRMRAAHALPSRMRAVTRPSWPSASVEEVPYAGEIQRDAGRLGGRDDLGVTHRATRLGDCAHTGRNEDFQTVREREVCVARRNRALRAIPCAGHREPRRVDAIDLTHPDTDRRA